MDYVAPALAGFGILINLALGLYVFFSNRNTAKDKELQETNSRLTKVEEQTKSFPEKDREFQKSQSRLSTLEERVKNMPSDKIIGEMQADIRGMQAEVEGLGKTLTSVETTVNRINDYLLNNRG